MSLNAIMAHQFYVCHIEIPVISYPFPGAASIIQKQSNGLEDEIG